MREDFLTHIAFARLSRTLIELRIHLAGICWPREGCDRPSPRAAEWLAEWARERPVLVAPPCTCAGGYCQICN